MAFARLVGRCFSFYFSFPTTRLPLIVVISLHVVQDNVGCVDNVLHDATGAFPSSTMRPCCYTAREECLSDLLAPPIARRQRRSVFLLELETFLPRSATWELAWCRQVKRETERNRL